MGKMGNKEIIAKSYASARELIIRNNPKAARAFVLKMLNAALDEYQHAPSALIKAKSAAFMDRWIPVSRELYSDGITDFVRECFGLDPVPKPSETGEGSQDWIADVFEKNRMAIVQINVSSDSGRRRFNGTGFIVSKNGYLLTNDHVVYDTSNDSFFSRVSMSLISEKKQVALQVLFSDKKSDVALCRFNPDDVKEFSAVKLIADYSEVKPGIACALTGNALGQGVAPSQGIVRFTENEFGNLVHTALSNPGDSGAPVFNRKGECIGIHKSKTVESDSNYVEAYGNATTVKTINALLRKWEKQGEFVL